MFALITFGAICLNRMGISQMPDVDFPILNISVNYEGAAPEVVEADLLSPLEERLLTIEGIKEMRSSASQGATSMLRSRRCNRLSASSACRRALILLLSASPTLKRIPSS
jgi:hypothetical protein